MVAGLMVVVGLISYYASRQTNPITGEKQAIALTPQQEVALGLQSAPKVAEQFGGADADPTVQADVGAVGEKVVRSSVASRTPYRFRFTVLADPDTVNAFALPGGPIFITRGLLKHLNRNELQGVIGHEMAHVLDRDILVGTVVATLVGAAVLLAEFFMRMWWWGGFRGRRGSDSGGGAASALIFAVGFVLLILAPIFGQLIRLAVSRNREFLADAQGAMLTRYPPGLISALKKLQNAPTAMRSANNATAHLWLNQPSRLEGERLGAMERLFSTHPPLPERIRRLEEM